MKDGQPVIRLERVSKSFGGRPVLREMSFSVERGTAYCLLGRSGTGKSVTLKHIVGLEKPDSGRVVVAGADVASLDAAGLSRLRRGVGFLFQGAALFDSLTVGENVMFPLRRHSSMNRAEMAERAREALASVGLEQDFDKMPAELSGGMRKRAGLARAMALEPPILLVDEPSAGLDPITSEEIDRLLIGLKAERGTTLVVVTHDIPSARLIGDVLGVIDGGQLIAEGTAEELAHSGNEMVRRFMEMEGGG
ncbi:MAG: ABC transporter ATP-binding protein [Vicinamibacterales bacterium]